jgi:hypothetical protein
MTVVDSVRFELQPTIDNPDSPPVFMDARRDSERKLVNDGPLPGWQGTPNQSERYPFVYDLLTGRVDYGSGYDRPANERYAVLELAGKPIVEGLLVTISSDNWGDNHYRVSRIHIR